MNELPPDPARLRTILAHLEAQLADEETVVTYLRLQQDAVRHALAVAEARRNRRSAASTPSAARVAPRAWPGAGQVQASVVRLHGRAAARPPVLSRLASTSTTAR
ncbi:hypothetical protein C4B68_12785 [Streptomyces dengpaensis]|uniref:Uncharacterized protein n=1 Tax=Streptomyces dengpaensis TaxID=2049881 RepID=A0ABN5HZJ7_9ACTN|nr:hypothetical protein C4B68_12785 [Streptomyces dengpaensis]